MHQPLLAACRCASGPCVLVVPEVPSEKGAARAGWMRHCSSERDSDWPLAAQLKGPGRERERWGCWGRYCGILYPPSSSFTPGLSFPLGGPGWLERTRVKAPGQFGVIPVGASEMPCTWCQVIWPISPSLVLRLLLQHLISPGDTTQDGETVHSM